MSEHLFTYGTLLPERAPRCVADAVRKLRYIGRAFARGRLYDLGDYPGAALDAASPLRIAGRVFALPGEDVWETLDAYEGVDPQDRENSLFVREQTAVALEDGRQLSCWIYVYNRDVSSAKLIASGDYLNHLAAQAPSYHHDRSTQRYRDEANRSDAARDGRS